MARRLAALAAVFWGCLLGAPKAAAHALGESYLFLKIRNDSLQVRFQAAVQDLDMELGLDADRDGRVSATEVESSIERIRQLTESNISVGTQDASYRLEPAGHTTVELPIGRFVELAWESRDIGVLPDALILEYNLFFDRDPNHRMLVVVEENERTAFVSASEEVFLVFGPDERRQELELATVRGRSVLPRFIALGVHHIAFGLDHILFLVALVLPSVLVRRENGWKPSPNFRTSLAFVVGVVTLFTIAHSATLSAAAFRIMELPSRLVESVIALSVMLAGLNNFFPMVRERAWLVVFVFGLFHGFGFASVLDHLVFNRSALFVPLLGFNLGVELGQVAIILVVFPLLFLMRRHPFYRTVVLRGGSALIVAVAGYWFVQRAFGG